MLKELNDLPSILARSLLFSNALEKVSSADTAERFGPSFVGLPYAVERPSMGQTKIGTGLFSRLTAYGTTQR